MKALAPARTVALLVVMLLALGVGTAGAAGLVTGRQVKDESVTGADVRNRSLTGRDIRDGSLQPRDVVPPPAGPEGPQGPIGPPGRDGLTGATYATVTELVGAGSRLSWTVKCEYGDTAIGGGVSSDAAGSLRIIRSWPDGFFWSVGVHNTSDAPVSVTGWAVCVPLNDWPGRDPLLPSTTTSEKDQP